MIDKNRIAALVKNELKGTDYFLVNIEVNSSNVIDVYVDGDSGISIHECVKISRLIGNKFDRDEEDYALRVSSPGLDKPFKQIRQYQKYIGRDIQLLTQEEEQIIGKLVKFNELELDLEIAEGKKKKVIKSVTIPLADIKEGRPVISFKK